MRKVILHLCADTGSDTYPYLVDPRYEVMKVGKDIGVENYHVDRPIHGIIANPVCLEFSTARRGGVARNPEVGMLLVNECMRIIGEAKAFGMLAWYVIENPAKGVLRDYLGDPVYSYEPWWYGSPWSKRTSLWGSFNIPPRQYSSWDDVTKIEGLYQRPGRGKPSLAFCHKNHKRFIREFDPFEVDNDMEFRSLCSQRFAFAFKEANP